MRLEVYLKKRNPWIYIISSPQKRTRPRELAPRKFDAVYDPRLERCILGGPFVKHEPSTLDDESGGGLHHLLLRHQESSS